MTSPASPYVCVFCWLCNHEAERAVKVDRVWLCLDCVVALAEMALPDDRMRAAAAATMRQRHAAQSPTR